MTAPDNLPTRERVQELRASIERAAKTRQYLLYADERLDVLAILSAYLRLTQENEWRPISTAPCNKKVLLCWPKHGLVRSGYFDVDEDFENRPRGWASPECGWRNDGDQCIPRNQEDCTLWRPLPPPSENSTGGGKSE